MDSSNIEPTLREALCELEKFTYAPLLSASSIRLLEISPDKSDPTEQEKTFSDGYSKEILVCNLHTLELDNCEPPASYDALSYTWGNPFTVFHNEEDAAKADMAYDTKVPIICDGMVIEVGRNLYDALVSLRTTRRSGCSLDVLSPLLGSGPLLLPLIWIDALCINQEDLLERSAQVRIMDRIYRTARTVHIWLGPLDDFTLTAIKVMNALAEAPPGSVEKLELSHDLESLQYQELGIAQIEPVHWQCFFAFLERRWFRRAWIIQEVALSNLCLVNTGSVYFAWSKLAFATGRLRGSVAIATIWNRVCSRSPVLPIPMYLETKFASPSEILEINPATIVYMIANTRRKLGFIDPLETYTKPPGPISRLDVLARFRKSQCQDPRDRVYAFLSLWPTVPMADRSPKRFLVDYSRTVAQVYTDAAWAILESCQNLGILSHVVNSDGDDPRTPSLPSWVPDWNCGTSFYSFENLLRLSTETDDSDPGCPYRSSEGRVWQAPHSSSGDPALLKVQGKKAGTVKAVANFDRLNLELLVPILLDIQPLYVYWKVSSAEDENQTVENPTAEAANLLRYRQHSYITNKNHTVIQSFKIWNTYERVFDYSKVPYRRVKKFEPCFESPFEAVWRTLIADVWQNQCPAPVHAGLALGDFIIDGMSQLLTRFQKIKAGDVEEVRNILTSGDYDRIVSMYLDGSSNLNTDVAEECERSWKERMKALLSLSSWEELSIQMYAESFPHATRPESFLPHVEATTDIPSYQFKGPKDSHIEWSRYLYKEKSLFSTSTGNIGSSSTATRTGDEIWILAGSNFPFILRPLQNGHYGVVGEAYVRGIMNGEAIWLGDSSDFTEIILE